MVEDYQGNGEEDHFRKLLLVGSHKALHFPITIHFLFITSSLKFSTLSLQWKLINGIQNVLAIHESKNGIKRKLKFSFLNFGPRYFPLNDLCFLQGTLIFSGEMSYKRRDLEYPLSG